MNPAAMDGTQNTLTTTQRIALLAAIGLSWPSMLLASAVNSPAEAVAVARQALDYSHVIDPENCYSLRAQPRSGDHYVVRVAAKAGHDCVLRNERAAGQLPPFSITVDAGRGTAVMSIDPGQFAGFSTGEPMPFPITDVGMPPADQTLWRLKGTSPWAEYTDPCELDLFMPGVERMTSYSLQLVAYRKQRILKVFYSANTYTPETMPTGASLALVMDKGTQTLASFEVALESDHNPYVSASPITNNSASFNARLSPQEASRFLDALKHATSLGLVVNGKPSTTLTMPADIFSIADSSHHVNAKVATSLQRCLARLWP